MDKLGKDHSNIHIVDGTHCAVTGTRYPQSDLSPISPAPLLLNHPGKHTHSPVLLSHIWKAGSTAGSSGVTHYMRVPTNLEELISLPVPLW